MSVRLSVRSLGFLRFSWFFISGKFVQLRATLSKTNFNILEALSCQGDFVDQVLHATADQAPAEVQRIKRTISHFCEPPTRKGFRVSNAKRASGQKWFPVIVRHLSVAVF